MDTLTYSYTLNHADHILRIIRTWLLRMYLIIHRRHSLVFLRRSKELEPNDSLRFSLARYEHLMKQQLWNVGRSLGLSTAFLSPDIYGRPHVHVTLTQAAPNVLPQGNQAPSRISKQPLLLAIESMNHSYTNKIRNF